MPCYLRHIWCLRARLRTNSLRAAIAATAATAASTAVRLQFWIDGCPLSRQRVYHRQWPEVPGVDELYAAQAEVRLWIGDQNI